jgi:hypothetical protein
VTESSLFVDEEQQVPIVPPKPYVQSLTPSGILKIGFTSPMKVPKDLKALNDKKVALRWNQANDKETYMTPDGYREFEVRPAVDVRLNLSSDSDQEG